MALLAAVSFGGGQSQLLFGVFAVAALRLMPSVRGIMSGWATIRYNRYTIPILREAALHEPASAHPGVPTRETLPSSAKSRSATSRSASPKRAGSFSTASR